MEKNGENGLNRREKWGKNGGKIIFKKRNNDWGKIEKKIGEMEKIGAKI